MVSGLEAARQAARRAIESTYEGTCSVIQYQSITDEKTRITSQKEVLILENQPCRLSFEKLSVVRQTETAAVPVQNVKLFLAPEIPIWEGSKMIVTQQGITAEYAASGVPAVYSTHQEIMLQLFEGWA